MSVINSYFWLYWIPKHQAKFLYGNNWLEGNKST